MADKPRFVRSASKMRKDRRWLSAKAQADDDGRRAGTPDWISSNAASGHLQNLSNVEQTEIVFFEILVFEILVIRPYGLGRRAEVIR